jgi:hypothetical protein
MSIPNTAFSASSQPCISNRPVAATQGDAQHSRQAEPSVVAAAALQPQQGSQILEVDDGRHQDQRQQRQQQHRDAVIAAVAAAATASTSPEKSPNKAAARPLDATSGAMADIEHVMGGHVQECRHTYKDAVLFGRRCQALSKVRVLWMLPKWMFLTRTALGVLLRLQRFHFPQRAQGMARAVPLCAKHEAGVLRNAR